MTSQTAAAAGAPTPALGSGPSADARRSRRAAAHAARPAEGPGQATRQGRDRELRRRRRLHLAPRTVRARIVCLLALPVISLTSLWGIAAVDTISAAYTQDQLRTLDSAVAVPLDDTVAALQQERSAAAAYLAVPNADPGPLDNRISATLGTVATLGTGTRESAAAAADVSPKLGGQFAAATAALTALSPVRTAILSRSISPGAVDHAYAVAIDDAFAVQSALAAAPGAPATAQGALALSEAGEQIAEQNEAMSSAHAAGSFSPAAFLQFSGAVYAQHAYLRQAGITLPDPTATADGRSLANLQNAVLAAGPGNPGVRAASTADWNAAAPAVLAQIDAAQQTAAAPGAVNPYSRLLTTGSGFGVLLGLFALVVSLLISVGIGRRLVTDLVGLRDYALDLAGRRLPETMARLRAGQVVEPAEQNPPLDPDAGELGQVADALAVASRAAMQAAVERAELVSGVSGVFLNLARRSQVLVHRQLSLLDTMERRTEEPDHLEDLFRLDHLATRMRRHAEGLIILSGATPGRAWRHPVDLTDVVRAAAAEAEDYPRVEVRRMPRARVLGPVVADLTHLLAELIENATSFSPPHTRVVVGGEPVGSGYAIEIEDRGLGMSPNALHEANRRIGESSGDDLFDSDRLGLFVVSRLARRHDIRVSLCASAYGGITAVVLIPSGVMRPPGQSGDAPGAAAHPPNAASVAPRTLGFMPRGALESPANGASHDAATAATEVTRREIAAANGATVNGAASRAAAADDGAPGGTDLDDMPMFGSGGWRIASLPAETAPTAESAAAAGSSAPPSPTASADGFQDARAHEIEPSAAFVAEVESFVAEADSFPAPRAEHRPADQGAHRDGPPNGRDREGLTPPPATLRPAIPAASAEPARHSPAGPDGLPRRVRQASLAPQLRIEPEGGARPVAAAPGENPTRPSSPELNQAAMSAFQRGYTRGRAEEPQAAPDGAADHDKQDLRGDKPR